MKRIHQSETLKRLLTIAILIGLFVPVSFAQRADNYKSLNRKAEKSLKSLDYVEAAKYAIASIRIKNDFRKSQEAFYASYPNAVDRLKQQIQADKRGSQTFRNDHTVTLRENVVNNYEELIELTNEARDLDLGSCKKCPPKQQLVFGDYYAEVENARILLNQGKEDAAAQHYKAGVDLMSQEGIAANRRASERFKKCMKFVPGYKDAESKRRLAKDRGTTRIAVIPFVNRSGKNHYGSIGEIISDEVISKLMQSSGHANTEYLEVYNSDDIKRAMAEVGISLDAEVSEQMAVKLGNKLGVSHVLTGQINQIVSHTGQTITQNLKATKNVVTHYVTKVNKKGKSYKDPVYGDVYAYYTTYSRQGYGQVKGSTKIIQVSNGRLAERNEFEKRADFEVKWGSGFRGDQRALSKDTFALTQTPEQTLPPDEERVNQATEDLGDDIARQIISFSNSSAVSTYATARD